MKRNLSSSAGRGLAMGQMLLCALLWSIGGIFLKQVPYNAFAILFFRGMFAVMPCLFHLLHRRIRPVFSKKTLLHGLFQSYTGLAFVVANKLTTAANAIVLQYTGPVFLLLFTAIKLRRRHCAQEILTVLGAFLGIGLVFWDAAPGATPLGDCIATTAGISMALMFMAVGEETEQEQFSGILAGHILTMSVGLLFGRVGEIEFAPWPFACMAILGIFQLGIPYCLHARAGRVCPPMPLILLSLLEPLLNPVWVMLFDGETPGPRALLGGLLVLAVVTAYSLWENRPAAAAAGQ